METRRHGLFSVVNRVLSLDQYRKFSSTYGSQRLVVGRFKTKGEDNEKKTLEIVCTADEEFQTIAKQDTDFLDIFRSVMFNPIVLKRSLQLDLYKLGFFKTYQMLYNLQYVFTPLDYPEYDGVFSKDGGFTGAYEDPLGLPSFGDMDEFQVFMQLYGGTMKGG